MPTPPDFKFDVFLSHSSNDKPTVREIAERLLRDGLRVWLDEREIHPGDNIPAKIEEGLEKSRVMVFCMSANSLGGDWPQLEANTFRFRDPLNKERRFIPLRLDDTLIKGSLAQFLYIDWDAENREKSYPKLLESCRPSRIVRNPRPVKKKDLLICAFNQDGTKALTGGADGQVRVFNVSTKRQLLTFSAAEGRIWSVAWSPDQRRAVSGSQNGAIHVWDLEKKRRVLRLEGHTGGITGLAWSDDQR